MKRLIPLLLIAAACASTHVTNVYRAPDSARPHLTKIAAIALGDSADLRRATEDEMAKQSGRRGVAGYTVLSEDDRKSAESIRAKLQSAGFDGAVTMRLLSMGEEP